MMPTNRKGRRVVSQRSAKSKRNSANFARTFASFAVKFAFASLIVLVGAQVCLSQNAPEVFKVDPPSWWARSSLNPVRLMIRGRNLKGARVQVVGHGVRLIGAPKINERGTYLFINAVVDPRALPGPRQLRITTGAGFADAWFEVLLPLNLSRPFPGFLSV